MQQSSTHHSLFLSSTAIACRNQDSNRQKGALCKKLVPTRRLEPVAKAEEEIEEVLGWVFAVFVCGVERGDSDESRVQHTTVWRHGRVTS